MLLHENPKGRERTGAKQSERKSSVELGLSLPGGFDIGGIKE